MTNNDLHALVGAYVMDALDEDERQAFEAYMAVSPATAAEVDSLREAAALLGGAAAETPPEGLRRAVMQQVETTRQLRPQVDGTPAPRPAPPTDLAAHRAERERRQGGRRRSDRATWITRGALGVAAAAVALSVGLGASLASLNERLDAVEGTNSEVATLLVAPDAVRRETALPAGGTVTALISGEHGTAVAVAEELPPLDERQMYALWAIIGGSPVPVGELVNGQPLTVHSVGLDGLGLTVEPRGELHQPTGAIQATIDA